MTRRTLVLTNWYFPYQILTWQDAVTQIFTGDSVVVAEYNEDICSPSVTWKCPAVVKLVDTIPSKRKPNFSRFNLFTRDKFTCQYCHKRKKMGELTFDHMIPRKKGGQTTWTNIVAACYVCNGKKDCMTCDQAGMFPRNLPVKPKHLPLVPPIRDISLAPPEWHAFLEPFLVGV